MALKLLYKNSFQPFWQEFEIGFSQTAREYYKAQQRAQAEQEASDVDEATTATTTTADAGTESEYRNPTETIINPAELPDDKQSQDEAKNGQSPFAHLSRAELLKRIGIN